MTLYSDLFLILATQRVLSTTGLATAAQAHTIILMSASQVNTVRGQRPFAQTLTVTVQQTVSLHD